MCWTGAAIATVLMLGACSTDGTSEGPEASPWEPDVRALAESTSIDLVRHIAQDGTLEEHEYREVQDAFIACMGDRGLAVETWVDEFGVESYQTEGEYTEELKSVQDECEISVGLREVVPLYTVITTNPNRVDFNELIAQCLREFKVVDETYTGEQYAQDLKDQNLPGTGSPESSLCLTDPLQAMENRE